MDWQKYSAENNWHAAANLFPLMNADELDALAADIKQNGLQNPILLFENKVLDGRNRLRACVKAEVEPKFAQWNSKNISPFDFAVSQNLVRRHLTRDQQTALAAKLKPLFEKEARERQIAAGKHGQRGGRGHKKAKPSAQTGAKGSGKSAARAARLFPDVSQRAVEQVSALEKWKPGIRKQIEDGEITIREALKEREKEQFSKGGLSDRFIVPPFSILDTGQAYWQKRKAEWGYVFDPVLCEITYRWFGKKGGSILDPFSNGSTRGIVAAWLGYDYTGIEWTSENIKANQHQADIVRAIKPRMKMPKWILGNGTQARIPAAGNYDLIFSAAPLYAGGEEDIQKYGSYEKFLVWFDEVVGQSAARLKRNRFAVLALDEVRDENKAYRNFVGHTQDLLTGLGLRYYNRAELLTGPTTLPLHITCFFNGDDAKQIPKELGELDNVGGPVKKQ